MCVGIRSRVVLGWSRVGGWRRGSDGKRWSRLLFLRSFLRFPVVGAGHRDHVTAHLALEDLRREKVSITGKMSQEESLEGRTNPFRTGFSCWPLAEAIEVDLTRSFNILAWLAFERLQRRVSMSGEGRGRRNYGLDGSYDSQGTSLTEAVAPGMRRQAHEVHTVMSELTSVEGSRIGG